MRQTVQTHCENCGGCYRVGALLVMTTMGSARCGSLGSPGGAQGVCTCRCRERSTSFAGTLSGPGSASHRTCAHVRWTSHVISLSLTICQGGAWNRPTSLERLLCAKGSTWNNSFKPSQPCANEGTEAQKGQVSCPKSHSKCGVTLWPEGPASSLITAVLRRPSGAHPPHGAVGPECSSVCGVSYALTKRQFSLSVVFKPKGPRRSVWGTQGFLEPDLCPSPLSWNQ